MKPQRIIVTFFLLIFIGVAVFAAYFFMQTREEYAQLKLQEAETARQLAEAERKLAAQEIILRRMQSDPAYVEQIIRQKLGYAKPDEFVFRFEN